MSGKVASFTGPLVRTLLSSLWTRKLNRELYKKKSEKKFRAESIVLLLIEKKLIISTMTNASRRSSRGRNLVRRLVEASPPFIST